MNPSDLLRAIHIIHSRINVIQTPNPTLLSGLGGKALFYSYLNDTIKNDSYERITFESVQNILDHLDKIRQNPSLADGYTGIAWLLQHLLNEELFDQITMEVVSGFDLPVLQSIPFYKEQKNYDPLYGAVGAGIYFLERKRDGISGLHSVIKLLNEISIIDQDGLKWFDQISQTIASPNLGLSHGVPGVIIFLVNSYELISEVYDQDIELLQLLENLIRGSINWLLSQENSCGKSLFPNNSEVRDESRLGWSYGDLGIAVGLLHAGKLFRNHEWVEKGIQVGIHTIDRNVESSQIYLDYELIPDAGFCNGSAGISVMYQELYLLSGHKSFEIRSEFWKDQTVSSILKAGKVYGLENAPASQSHWWNDISLIKGLSGIGLSLLNNDYSKQGWKRSLLLT